MKLYSPGTGVKINVDKEQAQTMLDAGWTKTPPIVEPAGEALIEDPLSSDDPIDDAEDKSSASKRKRIQKKE